MPDIGSVTARIDIRATGADQAAKQLDMAAQKVSLLSQKLSEAQAVTAEFQQSLARAVQMAVQMGGGLDGFQRQVAAVKQGLDSYSATLDTLAAAQREFDAVLAKGGTVTQEQRDNYRQLTDVIDTLLVARAELMAQGANLLAVDEALAVLPKEIADAQLKEIAATERLAKAQGATAKQTTITTSSMSRFARILNVLRHPRYLLTIEGMSFAFRELGGAMDGPIAKFKALPGLVKGALGVFAGLAAILAGGLFLAFKAVNSETAKMIDQMTLLRVKLQNVTGSSDIPQWMDDIADRTRTTRQEVALLATDMQLLFQGQGLGAGSAQGLTKQILEVAEGLQALRPEAGFAQAVQAAQGIGTGNVGSLQAYGINTGKIEDEWKRIARAQGTSVEFLTDQQRTTAALAVIARDYGNAIEQAKDSMGDQVVLAQDVARALKEFNEPTEEVETAMKELVGSLETLLGQGSALKGFWDDFRVWGLGALKDIVVAIGYLANRLNQLRIDTQGWLTDLQIDLGWEQALPPSQWGDDVKDATTKTEELIAARDRLAGLSFANEAGLAVLSGHTAQQAALGVFIRDWTETTKITEAGIRGFGEGMMFTADQMTEFIKNLKEAERAGQIDLDVDDLKILNRLFKEFEAKAVADEAKAAAEALESLKGAAEDAAGAFDPIEKAINDTNQAFGLINSWKGLVESFKAAQQDPSAEKTLAFWQQYSQFVLQAADQGAAGIERLRSQIASMADMGASPKMIELMNIMLDETARAVAVAEGEADRLTEGIEKTGPAATTAGAVIDTAMGKTETAAEQAASAVDLITAAIQRAKAEGADPIDVIVNMGYASYGSEQFSLPGGAKAGQKRGGPTNTPAPTKVPGPDDFAYGQLQEAINKVADLDDPITEAARQAKAIADAAKDKDKFDFSGSVFGGGGGGGGGGAAAASLDDIRKLIQEVNRAIRIGITGSDVGFAGNAIPAGGPSDYLSAEGGGLSIQTLIIKGVWDFTDPAAKRKIIRELEEALKGLKAEV